MKILYLHQYFNTPSMSGITRSYEMARRLVQRGHEVHMITADCTREGGGWHETVESGIHVHWIPVAYANQMSFARRIRAFLEFAWFSGRRAARQQADLVFATSTPLTIALPAVYAARKLRVPMVFEVRDLWPEVPIALGALRSRWSIAAARRLERFAYAHAAHVVALSPGMRDGIVSTGYPAERVTVVPNACDVELFRVPEAQGEAFRRAHGWLGQRPLVLYGGTLGLVNGVDYLARVAAAALARDPEVRFLVVGSGKQYEKVRDEARRLGVLDRNFFMLPPLPKANMPAVLSAADLATSLFIGLKALETNSANKLFDALAAGRPVAVNHGGWLAELIERTGCGLTLDPSNPQAAAERIVGALGDPGWKARARAAARRLADTELNREYLFERWQAAVLGAASPGLLRRAA